MAAVSKGKVLVYGNSKAAVKAVAALLGCSAYYSETAAK